MIRTPLKKLQEEARDWLISREQNSHHGMLGGFFCDDPGMGKTLSLLSLILSHKPETTTLVVAPANVIEVWKSEVFLHTNLPPSNLFIYHGPNRGTVITRLETSEAKFPKIVLTSYGIVRSEAKQEQLEALVTQGPAALSLETRFFKEGSVLNQIFERVILDEAHFIKDRKSRVSRAVLGLRANSRWVVTATPLSNDLDEDFSYFRFLGILSDFSTWRGLIPATNRSFDEHLLSRVMSGVERIKGLKEGIYLRRDKSALALPRKHEYTEYIQPSRLEVDFYDALYTYSVRRIQRLQHKIKNRALREYSSILSQNTLVLILRLRQACLSPMLVIQNMKRFQKHGAGPGPTTKSNDYTMAEATKMLHFLNKNTSLKGECPTCMDAEADSIAKPCGHKLCANCWEKTLESQLYCPFCRKAVIETVPVGDLKKPLQLNELFTISGEDEEDLSRVPGYNTSAKVDRAIEIIAANIDTTKIVIVSQWVAMLDYTAEALKNAGYGDQVVRIEGKMQMAQRIEAIRKIQSDPKTRICLISLTCSAEGITLTRATILIHLDQWWNHLGKPEQISNRIHRIGQDKEVKIIHLRVRGTIEDNISDLQDRKTKLISLARDPILGDGDQKWHMKVNLLR